MAVGRIPNTDKLSLEVAGVKTNDRGFIQVNDRLETSASGIYAIGDVKGGPAFTHISYDDFRVLKTNFLEDGKATTENRMLPYTVFIDPQLGRVGLTEKEAKKAGDEIVYIFDSPHNLKEGDKVTVKIDPVRRMRLMKLHSASHLIYFLVDEKIGLKKIIGSNVTEDKGRLDYEYPEAITPILPEVEESANELFNRDFEISIYPDSDDPNKHWWECKGWKVPCGGTHVKNTKEIGNVRLKRKNIGSGKERIEIYLA